MPDTGLLLAVAEIAGIFVGFGALISVRSTDPGDAVIISSLRFVTWVGVWILISCLAPVALSQLGFTGHVLWLTCALFALAALIALWLMDISSPESKSFARLSSRSLRRLRAVYVGVGGPLGAGLIASLAAVALGIWPEAERGLYFAAVVLGMALAGFTLLTVVFMAPHR
ncbi:hypothetical protein GCM10012320_32330 [Sinomonas cellulolyticus]|uniref:Uncharacterized protein n=1 Tax=Sinomonas cellulolyticus TaxID=2801916 RepID=A0ABS1K1S7_9MICC|nr:MULTISPECIES: hypothetical protein [Sinomonas]MBL0704261.1 hypothetical protein [Sinomonas cellulolyticus]GHG58601.1 hypothetical protein GCM10012320_32330 [Sinomonas sp. KCTC 49339]